MLIISLSSLPWATSPSLYMNLLSICDRNISWVKTLQNNVFFSLHFLFLSNCHSTVSSLLGTNRRPRESLLSMTNMSTNTGQYVTIFNALLFNIDIHSLSQNHKPISTFPGSKESATFHMGPIIWEEGVPNTSPSMVVHHSIMFPARLFLHQRMVITDAQ